MSDYDGLAAVVDAGRKAVTPFPSPERDRDLFICPLPTNGGANALDLEKWSDVPRRKRGDFTTFNPEAFSAYWQDHATDESRIWAELSPTKPRIVGVLNPHLTEKGLNGAQWHDHRVYLEFRTTPEWDVWNGRNGAAMDQLTFGEFIEDNVKDIKTPSGAEMLEIALSIDNMRNVAFKSARNLQSGAVELQYVEKDNATAAGGVEIPRLFTIVVAPFDCSPAYEVNCRFRWRQNSGVLALLYKMERPHEVIREAIKHTVARVVELCGRDVMWGWPADLRK